MADSQRQRDDCRKQRTGPPDFKVACGHLKNQTARSEHHAVKFSAPHHARKGLKTVTKQFRKGKGHLHDGKTKQDVPVGVAAKLRKAGEQKADRNQLAEGDQEAGNEHQRKGKLVFHDALRTD